MTESRVGHVFFGDLTRSATNPYSFWVCQRQKISPCKCRRKLRGQTKSDESDESNRTLATVFSYLFNVCRYVSFFTAAGIGTAGTGLR